MFSTVCKFCNNETVKTSKFYICDFFIRYLNHHDNSSFGKTLFDVIVDISSNA